MGGHEPFAIESNYFRFTVFCLELQFIRISGNIHAYRRHHLRQQGPRRRDRFQSGLECLGQGRGGLSLAFYTPKGLRTLAQGWRTRLPWVRQKEKTTPKGLRRNLDVMLKNEESNSRRNPVGVERQKSPDPG